MKLPLHVRILLGMAAGVLWALLSSFMGWSRFNLDWIDPFGKIFVNLLKLVAVPSQASAALPQPGLTECHACGRNN